MKNKKIFQYLGGISILLLNGCGSSSVTQTVTGQFVDTFVSGLKYTCSSGKSGITNVKGEYTCVVGDRVEFFLGKYKLGSATASSSLITPEILYPNSPEAELNVAQLLQTLDSDLSDGIITIPDNFSQLDNLNITPPTSSIFDSVFTSELGRTLVSEDAAQIHLNSAEIFARLTGKTFYFIGGSDNAPVLHTIVFNATLTSFDSTEDNGPRVTVLNGNRLVDSVNNEAFTLKESTKDYIVLNFFDNDKFDGTFRLYSDKTKADDYLKSRK